MKTIENKRHLLSRLITIDEKDYTTFLQKRIGQMPQCSEKSLLIILLSLVNMNLSTLVDDMKLLKTQIEQEKLISHDLDFLDRSYTKDNLSDLEEKLKNLKNKLIDLDFYRVLNTKAFKTNIVNIIQGGNIFLLIGPTGSGKSTILNYLAGSKMSMDEMGSAIATEVKSERMKRVKIKDGFKSETREVLSISIDFMDENNYESKILICDSPGFKDTREAEIDVINSIVFNKAISIAGGVVPLLVVDSDQGSKNRCFTSLCESLENLIPNKETIEKNVFYLFKRFKSEKDLENNFLEYSKTANGYVKFIYDDIRKKYTEKKNCYFINVLDNEPSLCLNKVKKMI